MKKALFALLVITLASCADNKNEQAQENKNLMSTDLVNNPATANGIDTAKLGQLPTMDFTDTLHNFGNMREGETVTYDFEFKNNGKGPLIISNASGSCGCTVAEYPNEPVPPGQSGKMTIKFNSAEKMGHQEKSVTINTNAGVRMLYIKADVQTKK